MSCGVGCRLRWDLVLLWLWHRLVATTPIWPLAFEPPYADGLALKRPKKKKKRIFQFTNMIYAYILLHIFGSSFFFLAPPVAYGHSWARGWNRGAAGGYTSVTHVRVYGNAGSLTHWPRPGIKPASSQRHCWVLNLLSQNGNSCLGLLKCF